jgi:hypothetical protein
MLGGEAIVDCYDKSAACCKCSNETFIMASISDTPASPMKDKDNGVLPFFRKFVAVTRGVVKKDIKAAG